MIEEFDRYDLGAPPSLRTLIERRGNIDEDFDDFSPPTANSGGGNPGLLIYRADGTQEFFARADIMTGYDASTDANWSLEFAVSGNALVAFSTTAPVGTTATERFDNDASASPPEVQTYYRIPVIRTITIDVDGTPTDFKFRWDITGIYRENIVCNGAKGATVELLQIG
jgi:hypothetical protein